LVQGINGDFYGTTSYGGASKACKHGCGTVFKMTPSGTLTTLHNFNSTNGADPMAGLVQGTDGNFYGTSYAGGAKGICPDPTGCGTVFKMTPSGTLTTLHSFAGSDGAYPYAGLVQATDGNFYGTTFGGGSCGGTIFTITPGGTLTTLYTFTCGTDGWYPNGGLVQGTDGAFYGTTSEADPVGGTVFSVSVGLGPFVRAQPTSGKVGTAVEILGTNLTGATSVTFNGAAATFTVNSSGAAISTTVPTGATTGTVQVVTPDGTLSSNVAFRVP
jgi:uncharacterized repeat protein (TIGR03803 family)